MVQFQAAMAKGAINLFVLGMKPLRETLSQCRAVLAAGSQDGDIQKFVLEHGEKKRDDPVADRLFFTLLLALRVPVLLWVPTRSGCRACPVWGDRLLAFSRIVL